MIITAYVIFGVASLIAWYGLFRRIFTPETNPARTTIISLSLIAVSVTLYILGGGLNQ